MRSTGRVAVASSIGAATVTTTQTGTRCAGHRPRRPCGDHGHVVGRDDRPAAPARGRSRADHAVTASRSMSMSSWSGTSTASPGTNRAASIASTSRTPHTTSGRVSSQGSGGGHARTAPPRSPPRRAAPRPPAGPVPGRPQRRRRRRARRHRSRSAAAPAAGPRRRRTRPPRRTPVRPRLARPPGRPTAARRRMPRPRAPGRSRRARCRRPSSRTSRPAPRPPPRPRTTPARQGAGAGATSHRVAPPTVGADPGADSGGHQHRPAVSPSRRGRRPARGRDPRACAEPARRQTALPGVLTPDVRGGRTRRHEEVDDPGAAVHGQGDRRPRGDGTSRSGHGALPR